MLLSELKKLEAQITDVALRKGTWGICTCRIASLQELILLAKRGQKGKVQDMHIF